MAFSAAPEAVLTARAASFLPPGLEAGAPVADPRHAEDDDADEMDLFLLHTDDEIERQNDATATPRGPVGFASSPGSNRPMKQEPLDYMVQAARTPSESSSGRKRKRPDFKHSPQTPVLSSGSKTAAFSTVHGKEGNLPFHLKRKRISDSSSRTTGPHPLLRALATDKQVAAVRSGTYPADDAGEEDDPDLERNYKERSFEDRRDAAVASAFEDDDDRPLGRLAPATTHTDAASQPGPKSLEADGPDPTSDMEESDEEGKGKPALPDVPYSGSGAKEEENAYEEAEDEHGSVAGDPMRFTWADLVSGSHDEVWDDSELVDTWSQAEAEYAILQERRKEHRELLQLKARVVQTRAKAQREARRESQSSHAPELAADVPPPAPDASTSSEVKQETANQPTHPVQPAQEDNKPINQSPATRISLPPVPPSHRSAGAGAMGLCHDEIMQNLAYSSFYFGYYRALADVSSQGGRISPTAPPVPPAPANGATAPPAPPTPITGAPAPTQRSSALLAHPQPATAPQQSMPYPYAIGHNVAYPTPMPYMPMAPYPQAMWPQFMPSMGQQ